VPTTRHYRYTIPNPPVEPYSAPQGPQARIRLGRRLEPLVEAHKAVQAAMRAGDLAKVPALYRRRNRLVSATAAAVKMDRTKVLANVIIAARRP
jgi:hypothetical protein